MAAATAPNATPDTYSRTRFIRTAAKKRNPRPRIYHQCAVSVATTAYIDVTSWVKNDISRHLPFVKSHQALARCAKGRLRSTTWPCPLSFAQPRIGGCYLCWSIVSLERESRTAGMKHHRQPSPLPTMLHRRHPGSARSHDPPLTAPARSTDSSHPARRARLPSRDSL